MSLFAKNTSKGSQIILRRILKKALKAVYK